MNRWLILILFMLSVVSGYFAFVDPSMNRNWYIDAIFLASVIIFLMLFIHQVGRSLKADITEKKEMRLSNPIHQHADSSRSDHASRKDRNKPNPP